MAKLLHPDRYHNEAKELLVRVERAFTELAQAHETLKNHESRKSYDLRMRQEADARERARESGIAPDANKQETQAAEDFERGLRLQLEGEFESAIPFLARAVYFAPKNARYHAYYGKALSADESQRHKAEGEMQAAIKLEPDNDSFRLMLAEFFIRYNLLKRAEGELTRLLKNAPGNKEAQALLDTLRSK
jgi:predicted Zn-dependent protease